MAAVSVWASFQAATAAVNRRRGSTSDRRKKIRELVAAHPEGMSEQDIISELGITVSQFKSEIHRVRLVSRDRNTGLWKPDPSKE